MKVALGMIAWQDREMQKVHMPLLLPHFDGYVCITEPTVDFAATRNKVINRAEKEGFSWLFMLDADECMLPRDIASVKTAMDSTDFILLPRIEFTGDRQHYDPTVYPDSQGRIFKLNSGYKFIRPVHEMLIKDGDDKTAAEMGRGLLLPTCHIYHYGRTKNSKLVWLKNHNYMRLMGGMPREIIDPPQDTSFKPENMKPFFGEQPV